MRSTMVVVMCVVMGALAGCGGGAEPAASPTAEANGATAADSSVILQFSRQGGIRGDDNAMTIRANGAVSVTTPDGNATLQLDEERLGELEAALADLDWPALEEVDGQPDPGDDAFTFVVATPTHGAVTVTRNNLDPYPDLFLQAGAIMDEAVETL